MQSLFRVYLDGQFLNDEPIGLIDTELTLARDEELKGVFFSFTTEITFYGDGYRILKDKVGCAQVPCNIEYKCAETGGYEVLYEAVIPLGSTDVKWDDSHCRVTTRLENADFSNFLKSYGDYVFRVNLPFCIDGATALPQITTNSTQLFGSFSGTLSGTGIKTYLFTDVLDQLLRFLTNNSVQLDADTLYSTLYTPQIIEIEYIDSLAGGDTVEIEWTNYYGQQYSTSFVATGVAIVDYLWATRDVLHIVEEAITPLEIQRTNFFEKAGTLILSGAQLFHVVNYLPWESFSISVNAGAKNATMTQTQAFQYGLKNLAVTNSALIQGQTGSLTTTLTDLLTHASQMHNMGFRNVKTGSGYEFQLRTMQSLLENIDTNVHLSKVSDITSKASKLFDAQGVRTPEGITDNIFKPFDWNSNTCYSKTIKAEGDKYSSQEFFDLINATQIQNNSMFFLFLKEGDYTEAERFETLILDNNATAIARNTASQYHYNIPYMMALIAKAYQVNVADNNLISQIPQAAADTYSNCANCPDARILNTNTVVLRSVVQFSYPLSYSQVRTLIDNALQFISFSDGVTQAKSGFMKEVKIRFNNFISAFELYTP